MDEKPQLLIISSVLPFPRASGQQQRVYYKLKALRRHFNLTFLTFRSYNQIEEIQKRLLEHCDNTIVLPSSYTRSPFSRFFHRFVGTIYSLIFSLRFSNYLVSQVEFTPARIYKATKDQEWDGVLYEYWHAVDTVNVFHLRNIPCILDTHDVLWRSLAHQYESKKGIPHWWRERVIRKYREQEEKSWNRYDALIAINAGEHEYMQSRTSNVHLFYAPMGTDLTDWQYSWRPSEPPRIVYYGGMGSPHNQRAAYNCCKEIMPVIWEKIPTAELWIVGDNPPAFLRALSEQDSRIKVTGFVERVQDVLNTMSVLLCPWSGTYGFRSRLIEAMALGVPIIASPDAVDGMGMTIGKGIFLETGHAQIACRAVDLLSDKDLLEQQSRLARLQVEEKFSYEATYERFSAEVLEFIHTKRTSGCTPVAP